MKPYYDDGKGIVIYHGDCREILPQLGKVDLVLTDPPYGLTSNNWDIQISMETLWPLLRNATTESAAFIFTASQPFSSVLVVSNLHEFRHEWIWIKSRGSNFANTVREPFKEHEHVIVFSAGRWVYNPQMEKRKGSGDDRARYSVTPSIKSGVQNCRGGMYQKTFMPLELRVPSSVQEFPNETGLHPTQKPCQLMSYLILTYSETGQMIMDPFMGSGTTLRAAKDLGRKAIGIEIEERYCEIAARRLAQEVFAL